MSAVLMIKSLIREDVEPATIRLFRKHFGYGTEINDEVVLSVVDIFDWDHLAERLLNSKARETYKTQLIATLKAYDDTRLENMKYGNPYLNMLESYKTATAVCFAYAFFTQNEANTVRRLYSS